MTRRSPALILPEHSIKAHKWKSLEWETSGYTPNEAYDLISEYRQYVDGFAHTYRIPRPAKFVQVRIVKQNPSIVFTKTKNWWDNSMFMDHVFWVFAKPVSDQLDGQVYTYYALEPKECVRVVRRMGERGLATANPKASFVIPVECVTLAWNERTNGVSDHIHWRPEVKKTQKQIDREAALDAQANRLLADAYAVTDDPRWSGAVDYLKKELKRRTCA